VRASAPVGSRQTAPDVSPRRANQGDPLRVIHDLTAALSTATSLDDIYREALTGLERALGADRAAVLLYAPDGVMRFVAWRGLSEGYRRSVEGHSPWPRDARAPEPIFVPDVMLDEPLEPFRDTVTAEGIRALGFLPLVHRERLLGKFMIYCDAPRRFTDDDAQLAKIIATQVAFAVTRRRAEERLALFQRVFVNASDGIGIIDPQGRYLEQNRAHAALLGYGDEELAGQTPALHLGEPTFAVIAAALADRGQWRGPVESRTKDGTLLDVELSAFTMRDEAGRVTCHVGMKRDITQQKRAERRLLLLSEASRRLMEAPLDPRATLDTVGRLVTERLARACLVVVHEDHDAETPPLSVGHDRDGAAADRLRAELARDGEAARAVARGEPVVSPELLAVPLRRQGQTIGIFGCLGPLGAPFEETDHLLVQELADRATLALDNAQLYRRTESAVKLRDDFLSIAGHELRTPLTALKLQLTALERVGVDAGSRQRLEAARRQVGRLTTLTDELLDVGRITTGRLTLELEPVDLTTVTLDVAGRLGEALVSSGSPLTIEASAPVVGRWDKMRLDQVITNLLTNAIKYGRGRPIQVVVETRGASARFTVRDEGIGIESDKQGKIFERFERAVSPRSYGGLGLGLWIVSQIVAALGGSIRVDSVPDQGSVFTVDLPLEPALGHARS
jgi:PAS domain S-box-containing protein